MNSLSIVELLQQHISESSLIDEFEIKNVFNLIQDQLANSIVFIKVTDKYNENYFLEREQQNVLYITTSRCGLSNELILKEDKFLDAQKVVCDYFYPINRKSKRVGITGTNGKTSTAYYLYQLLQQADCRAHYIGTIGIFANGRYLASSSLTSPSYLQIRKILKQDYDVFIFEVSSHALDQERFYQIKFNYAAWTSFSQDHLDYHKTMDEYFKSKLRILDHLETEESCFVYKKEKDLVKKLSDFKKVKVIENTNNFDDYFQEVNQGLALHIANQIKQQFNFNLKKLEPVPGRFEKFNLKSNKVIIDYAHTPEALRILLTEIKRAFSDKEIVCVFGCGGNRDKSKRALMAEAVSEFAHLAIITEDNNRSESFENIAKDIEAGMSIPYEVIDNRAKAIERACFNSTKSVIVIAGKGHEDTIDRGQEKINFSDRKFVQELKNAN